MVAAERIVSLSGVAASRETLQQAAAINRHATKGTRDRDTAPSYRQTLGLLAAKTLGATCEQQL